MEHRPTYRTDVALAITLDIMNITDYLDEVEYAATQVIASLWHEHKEAEALRTEIESLKRTAEANYSRAVSIQQNAEDPDDLMLGVGMYWGTYFSEDKDQHHKSLDLKALMDRLATREFSFASLAGTLLQFAKQGLSAVYGSSTNWPPGKAIGSQSLKTVILQARNQSEHWEEGNPRSPVEACFQALEAEKGNQFAHYKTKNLAFDVVSMLGWRAFPDFRSDMLTM